MAASLLGTFGAGLGAGPSTTGGRTSVSGSLVCAFGGANASGPGLNCVWSDSLGNSYTEPVTGQEFEFADGAGTRYLCLGYNLGGTRGLNHTISINDIQSQSVSGAEFDGVAGSPTVVTATNSGTGTAPTCQIDVGASPCLVIGMCSYAGANAALSVDAPATLAIAQDTAHIRAEVHNAYLVGQTGVVTMNWTLDASRDWAVVLVAFTEAGGAGTTYTQSAGGALTPTGALLRQAAKLFAGATTPSGALEKRTLRSLAGTLTSSSTLTAIKTALVFLTGSIASAGALSTQAGKVLAGSLASAGTLVRQTARSLAGSLATAGALTAIKTALISLAGTLSSAGALSRQAQKATSGVVTPAGSLARLTARALTGTLTTAGAVAKLTARAIAGALTFGGIVAGVIGGAIARFARVRKTSIDVCPGIRTIDAASGVRDIGEAL